MANKKDSLGDRMKKYEGVSRNYLTRRVPVIIRLDGKAFHTFTKGFKKPFDEVLTAVIYTVLLLENALTPFFDIAIFIFYILFFYF